MATELVKYLYEEVISDGLGGSSLARIDAFLDAYKGDKAGPGQVIDQALRRYLVASLLQQPNIVAGKFRPRSPAAQGKGKGKAKKRELSEDEDEEEEGERKVTKAYDTRKQSESDLMDTVEVDAEAEKLGLNAMVERYGDELRIAFESTKLREHLLGTAPELTTPMYYSYLLLLRSRGEGLTFPELGEALNYNPASVFWVGQVLQSNDLAYKLRDHVGRSLVSRLISKKYAHLCPKYSASERYNARMAEGQTTTESTGSEIPPAVADTANPSEMSAAAIDSLMAGSNGAAGGEENLSYEASKKIEKNDDSEFMTTLRGMLAYPQVNNDESKALLADRNVVRLRVLRLLIASRNHSTVLHDLVVRVGVPSAQKNERKVFGTIIKAMEDEGLIERFEMRRSRGMGLDEKFERCIRATTKGKEYAEVALAPPAEREAMLRKEAMKRELESSVSRLYAETTVERQVLEFVARTGATGALVDQTTTALGGDSQRRRFVEQILKEARFNNGAYEDLAIVASFEQDGRTRQSRFWTSVSTPIEGQRRQPGSSSSDTWIDLPGEVECATSKEWRKTMNGDGGSRKKKMTKTDPDGEPPKKKGRPTKEEATRKRELEKTLSIEEEAQRERDVEMHDRDMQHPSSTIPLPADDATPATSGATQDGDEPMREIGHEKNANDVFATGLGGSFSAENGHFTPNLSETTVMPATPKSSEVRQPGLPESMRRNRTVMMKIQMLEDFFEKVGIVESMAMQKQYVDFVQKRVGSEKEAQAPYMMDRKLRDKLFNVLTKQGKLKTTRVASSDTAVPGGASRQRILHWRSDLDLDRVASYSRAVIEGREGFQFSQRAFGPRQTALTVAEGHVDVPNEYYSRTGRWVNFNAGTLEDLVSKPQYRKQLVGNPICRERYAGRIVGSAARLQYFHTVIIGLLLDAANEYRVEQDVLDMAWFWTEADLRLYLRLAPVPMSETLLDASQDDVQRRRSLKMQNEEIGRALELPPFGVGGLTMMRPMLMALEVLGLARPVKRRTDGGIEECSWKDDSTLVRFELAPRHCGIEPSDLTLKSLDEPMTLASLEDADAYWAVVERVSQPPMSSSSSLILAPADDEDPESAAGQRRQVWESIFKSKSSWFQGKNILGSQRHFLQVAKDLGITVESLQDGALMDKVSYASLVPAKLVVRFYEREFNVKMIKSSHRRRRAGSGEGGLSSRTPLSAAAGAGLVVFGPMTKVQAARAKTREKRSRQERRWQWDERLAELLQQRGFSEEQGLVLVEALNKTKRLYVYKPEATKGLEILETSLDVIEEVLYPELHASKHHKGTESDDGDGEEDGEEADSEDGDPEISVEIQQGRGKKRYFEWNAASDELLRDACVILRARDKERSSQSLATGLGQGKLHQNWSALHQIFPDARSQTMLERFKRLQSDLGEEAYLAQLEAEWTQLWKAHRGTEALPDDDPTHPTKGFKLKRHVRFLRKNIDKIKVTNMVESSSGEPLPWNVATIAEDWDWERPPNWILKGKLGGSSGVGNASLVHTAHYDWLGAAWPLSMAPADTAVQGTKALSSGGSGGNSERRSRMAESLVKSMLVTGIEGMGGKWDEKLAVELVDHLGEDVVDRALTRFLRQGIIKKKQSTEEGRRLPGQNFAFVEELDILLLQENADGQSNGGGSSGGSNSRRLNEEIRMHAELAKRAVERKGGKKTEMSIFRDADDTDAALAVTLLSQMTSDDEGRVKAEWDLGTLGEIRDNRMVNSRKMEDFELEFVIRVMGIRHGDEGSNVDKIRQFIEVDCVAREEQYVIAPSSDSLEKAFSSLLNSLDDGDQELRDALVKIKAALVDASSEGLSLDQLLSQLDTTNLPATSDRIRMLDRVASSLTSSGGNGAEVPTLAVWTGFDEPRLVWSHFITAWCLPSLNDRQGHDRYFSPRLWKDVHGKVVMRVWKRCLKLVALHCLVRPGLTRAHLISTLAPLMDRREVVALLDVLCDVGLIQAKSSSMAGSSGDAGEVSAWQDNMVHFVPPGQTQGSKNALPWYAYAAI